MTECRIFAGILTLFIVAVIMLLVGVYAGVSDIKTSCIQNSYIYLDNVKYICINQEHYLKGEY